MVQRIKIYGKFVAWIFAKIFGRGTGMFASTKQMIAGDFNVAVFVALASAFFSALGTAIVLLINEKDISPTGSNQGAYVLSVSVVLAFYVVAGVSVLYDKFLAEYGHTFEVLKK